MSYAETIDRIRRLAKGDDSCDDELTELLLNSGCYYLLSRSEKQRVKAMSAVAVNSVMINHRYKACSNIFAMLDSIPYAHIKGAVLSCGAYGNPSYRSSGDIDLLVPSEYSDLAKSILTAQGFIQGRLVNDAIIPFSRSELIYQKRFSHQIAPFMLKTESKLCPFINIDVNFNIVWGEGNFKIDIREFVSNSEEFEIYGVKMRRLKPLWEFIALCMHHYKDMNSIYLLAERGLSLSEYCDIYFYIVNVSPDADELAKLSADYGVSDYVYYCIYYANEIFADKRLDLYLNKLRSESANKLINCYGLTDSERKQWDTPFFERLLNTHFSQKFLSLLTESEKHKIQINRDFM